MLYGPLLAKLDKYRKLAEDVSCSLLLTTAARSLSTILWTGSDRADSARLAAFYSKGRGADKVEIDYIQKKHIKKVAGAKPGFVIYHTNYSMVIEPKIDNIKMA